MAEVQIVDTPPPPPPPAPTTELHVTPAVVDGGPKVAEAEKGSARDRFNERMRKRANVPEPPKVSAPSANNGAAPNGEQQSPAGSPESKGGAETPPAPPTPEKTAEQPKPKENKNPWKLVDEYKARATKAETDLVEARKGGLNPAERTSMEETITGLRKQNEELENEIRFVNYAKSKEFKTEFQEPYEKAWHRATKEITQITITDKQGNRRKAEVGDLSALVGLNLEDARNFADDTFGKFADDAMGFRKEILGLWEAQEQALTKAKESGAARDQERMAQHQKFTTETAGQIKSFWDRANEGFTNDKDLGELFKPVDGDQDGNQRLAKGFELVDRAFGENPSAPGLTAEQREAIVKRHAAVRMRAAAFGRLRARYDALNTKFAAMEKELAQYKASVPGTGGRSTTQATTNGTPKAWDSLHARLQKAAHL